MHTPTALPAQDMGVEEHGCKELSRHGSAHGRCLGKLVIRRHDEGPARERLTKLSLPWSCGRQRDAALVLPTYLHALVLLERVAAKQLELRREG